MADSGKPPTHQIVTPLLEALAREVPDEEQEIVAFYQHSLNAEDWSAERGIQLASQLRSVPSHEWNAIPEFGTLGRLVLSVTSLFLWKQKKTDDHLLAWRMIKAGDDALRRCIADDDYGDGSRLTSVASWHVREAVEQVVADSRAT